MCQYRQFTDPRLTKEKCRGRSGERCSRPRRRLVSFPGSWTGSMAPAHCWLVLAWRRSWGLVLAYIGRSGQPCAPGSLCQSRGRLAGDMSTPTGKPQLQPELPPTQACSAFPPPTTFKVCSVRRRVVPIIDHGISSAKFRKFGASNAPRRSKHQAKVSGPAGFAGIRRIGEGKNRCDAGAPRTPGQTARRGMTLPSSLSARSRCT